MITRPGPDALDTVTTLDLAGRMETVQMGPASVTYVYDAAGRVKRADNSNNMRIAYTYDVTDRLKLIRRRRAEHRHPSLSARSRTNSSWRYCDRLHA